MKLDKTKARLSRMTRIEDDDYVDASISDRLNMVWDITVQLWSIATKGRISAESRLQRHIAKLTKP